MSTELDTSSSEMADFSVDLPSSEMTDFPWPTSTSCGPADAEKVMPDAPQLRGSIGKQFAACPAVAGHAKKRKKIKVTLCEDAKREPAVKPEPDVKKHAKREPDVKKTTPAKNCADVKHKRSDTDVEDGRRRGRSPRPAVAEQARGKCTRLLAAPSEQGPDLMEEAVNEKTDTKNSLNLVISLYVVFPDFDTEDLKNLLFNAPARLLVMLFDPATNPRARANVVEAVTSDHWRGSHWEYKTIGGPLGVASGVILYSTNTVREVAFVETVGGPSEDTKLQTMNVYLWGSKWNPNTAVAVGVLYLAHNNRFRHAAYSASLMDGIKSALKRQQARFLFGVFTCTPEQVGDIARSCGASGTRPFCQMFKYHSVRECTEEVAQRFEVDPQNGGDYVTHPSYAIVLGPVSKLEYAPTKGAPDMPAWLEDDSISFRSVCLPLHAIPSWEDTKGLRSYGDHTEGLRSDGDQLPDLGRLTQKPTKMDWWIPCVHQLMFYLGTARTGEGAKKKRQQAQRQAKNWKKRDDGWKVFNEIGTPKDDVEETPKDNVEETPKDNVKEEIEETDTVKKKKVGKWSKSTGIGRRRSYGVANVEDDDL